MSSRALTGPAFVALGDAGPDAVSTYVLECSAAAGFSLVVRARALGSPFPLDNTAPTPSYVNRQTGALVAGGTPITAPGVYVVPADGCALALDLASGSVGVTAVPLAGARGA